MIMGVAWWTEFVGCRDRPLGTLRRVRVQRLGPWYKGKQEALKGDEQASPQPRQRRQHLILIRIMMVLGEAETTATCCE